MTGLILALAVAAQGASPAEEFEQRLKAATGPMGLRELTEWCKEHKLKAEEERVREVISKIALPRKRARDAAKREAARRRAIQAREQVGLFLDERAESLDEELGELADWMREKKYAPESATELVLGIARRVLEDHGEKLAALEEKVRSLENDERTSSQAKSLTRQFDSRFKSIRREFTNKIAVAVDKCMKAGETGFAYDVYRWLLTVDPDNDRAHKGLGEVEVGGKWLRPFAVSRYRKGLVWDDRWGWIPRQEKMRTRYDDGEAYDHATKKWGKLSDLNERHADGRNPWKIESEHFLLISTADLERNVKLITRLEAFFLGAFRQFDRFFGGRQGTALIFGMSKNTKRLKVYFYRDRDQFFKLAKPGEEWVAGYYTTATHASYFYDAGRSTNHVLQHELTHQILSEFGRGGHACPWIAEGAATYLEDAKMKNGVLALGGIRGNGNTSAYRQRIRGGAKERSLEDMVRLFGKGGNWSKGEPPVIRSNYRGAAATWFFLMTFDNGRYRGDTVQLLSDAYAGRARDVHEYYGISLEGLTFLMDRFYRECEVD